MFQPDILILAEADLSVAPSGWYGLMFFVICGLLFVSLLFFFASELVIEKHKTVKRFRAEKSTMESLLVNKRFRTDGNMRDLCMSLVSDHNNQQTAYDNRRIGQAMTIIYWKSREIHELCKELRYYSGAFLLLFCVGTVANSKLIEESFYKYGLSGLGYSFTSYHVVPLLEVLMIVFLVIRFLVEIASIRNLLEEL